MSANTVNTRFIACLCAVALFAVSAAAPAQDTSAPRVAAAVAELSQPATANGVPESEQKGEAPDRELAGTSWRLVKIMSMEDRVYEPKDVSKYSLAFGADGTATMLADCNRGTGTWTSASASQLRFGPIAATKALCSPGSLSERYLSQFQWVRSYTLADGHLLLATVADGSIIELEPVGLPLAATVLGEEVRTSEPKEVQEIMLTRLFDRYAEERGIEVTDAEIDAFVENRWRGMRDEGPTAEIT